MKIPQRSRLYPRLLKCVWYYLSQITKDSLHLRFNRKPNKKQSLHESISSMTSAQDSKRLRRSHGKQQTSYIHFDKRKDRILNARRLRRYPRQLLSTRSLASNAKISFSTRNYITIHMPQQTSKTLLLRLTVNKNALLFQIRVTCFARYTVIWRYA